jgi:RNA polymerase sigma factor (sigma-70 family)
LTIDLENLYVLNSKRLERVVRMTVDAADVVIEDACQFAWSRLVFHAPNVQEHAMFSWLVRTASREAIRLTACRARELSFHDALIELQLDRFADPHDRIEERERLSLLGGLPRRQQRLLWLHAAGLSYREMARHERCTKRTVERQLLRAKGSIRSL